MLEYESLDLICGNCGCYGHVAHECCVRKVCSEKDVGKEQSSAGHEGGPMRRVTAGKIRVSQPITEAHEGAKSLKENLVTDDANQQKDHITNVHERNEVLVGIFTWQS